MMLYRMAHLVEPEPVQRARGRRLTRHPQILDVTRHGSARATTDTAERVIVMPGITPCASNCEGTQVLRVFCSPMTRV